MKEISSPNSNGGPDYTGAVEEIRMAKLNGGKSLDSSNGRLANGLKDRSMDGKDSENTYLINSQGLSHKAAVRFHKAALIVSIVSAIFSIASGIAALVLSAKGRSESLFAYGLDAILDSLSSIAVVWRFLSADIFSQSRERRACIIIGFLFLVSAISLIAKAIYAILSETHETKNVYLYEWFASTCAAISIILASTKVYLGYKLCSRALATDSIITYVGAVTCIAGVAGLELYNRDSGLWYLDSVFGIACGAFLLCFGIRLLYTSYFYQDESKCFDNS